MALRGLTLPSAGSLGDLHLLADSELDLSSWLFQDDLYQQDFGRGAKDMDSISSAVADHVSPSFITSQYFPDWMEASFEINWDHPLNLEECLNNDIKQQMQQQQTSSYEHPTKFTEHLFEDPIPPLPVSTPEQQPEYQRVFVLKNDINDVAYSDDVLSSSEGFDDSSTSFNASQESVSVCEEDEPFQLSASPFIISVPLTDVFAEQKPPTFKTINVTGIERINVAQKPVFCSTPIQSVAVSLPKNERREPQKIVINLRRVTLPVTNSCAPDVDALPTVEPLPQSGPTLKEALTMDDADDFIRDMVSMPTVVPAQPFEADRRNDSIFQSSEDFEDSGFGSPSELLLYSPSSSSELSSACGSVHSPEPYDDHSSKDDTMEENLLNSNISSSSCEESLRYAPYKSLEKKMRKKEQNKRAALRYRQKKKEEEEDVLGTLQAEEEKQKQLNEKYNALQMEVKLMKKLMREMLVKKDWRRSSGGNGPL